MYRERVIMIMMMISQLIAEFGGVLGGSEGVDESLEGGDGSVDLEYAGSHRLRGVLLPIHQPAPRTEGAPGLDVLKAHNSVSLSRENRGNFPEKGREKATGI